MTKHITSMAALAVTIFFTITFYIEPAADGIGILMLQMCPFEYWDIQNEFEKVFYECL